MNPIILAMLVMAGDTSYYARQKIFGAGDGAATTPPATTPAPTPTGSWREGSWGSWSSTCSPTATRTKPVECVASGDVVPDAQCSGTKPTSSETEGLYTGCADMIQNGGFATLDGWTGTGGYSLSYRYAAIGNALRMNGSQQISTTSYPLVAGKTYELTMACEAVANSRNYCHLTGSVTVDGKVSSFRKGTTGYLSIQDKYVTVVGTGTPATVTISTEVGVYVDNVTLKPIS